MLSARQPAADFPFRFGAMLDKRRKESRFLRAMQINVQLPDDLALRPDPARAALEAFVIEGYRSGALSHAQSGSLLGLSRFEFEGFLKDRQIGEHAYNVDELKKDWTTVQQDNERRLGRYTAWLRECPDAAGLSIEPTNDKGPYPYQWKIGTDDFSSFIGYVIFHGPAVGGSEAEKRQRLCELLREELKSAGGLS
jgi:predicted HTH domain antitoxin